MDEHGSSPMPPSKPTLQAECQLFRYVPVSAMADFDGLPGGLSQETWTFTSNACQDPDTGQSVPTLDEEFVCWSNWGPRVDVSAPGVRIYSTWLSSGYHTGSGTSMAAPHVAGAAALYIAMNRDDAPLTDLTGADRVAQVTSAITSSGWQFNDYGYFVGDTDGLPEPLLNVKSLLGANRPEFVVAIHTPENGSAFNSGANIDLGATASVNGDDWTAYIIWASSIDGVISTAPGGSIQSALSDGFHTITASITDASSSFSGWSSISITVGEGGSEIEPPPSPRELFLQIWTDKTEYVHGETMHSYFLVTETEASGAIVEGAAIQSEMIDAKGGRWTVTGTTDADGLFVASWKVNSGRGGTGAYTINGTATKDGYFLARGSTTFLVK
jgi:hypothetical protein